MKGKQLVTLLILAAVAGSLWYLLGKSGSNIWSESAGGGGKVLEFPINEVARLRIQNAAGELNLVKKGDAWVVRERADYPASFKEVSEFLRKLWDLKTGQEIKVGPSQMTRLELMEPGATKGAGTLVEASGPDGKVLAALLIGKKYGNSGPEDLKALMDVPKGRYVKPLNNSRVSLVTDPLDDAQPTPSHWLLKDFVSVTGPKSIAVAGPGADHTWTVTRENVNAKWQLADARPEEKLDSGKTFRLNQAFLAPTFFDVLPPDADPKAIGLDQPTLVKIETFDSFHYEFQIGRSSGETYPLLVSVTADLQKERPPDQEEKPADKSKRDAEFQEQQKQLAEKLAREQKLAARAFLVPKLVVEELLKDRAALLADHPTAPAPGSSTAISSAPPASTEGTTVPAE